MGLQIVPDNLNIDFVGIRKISYVISIAVILVGLVALVVNGGPRYGIDFAGGATVQIRFEKPVSDEVLKKSLETANLPGLAIQQFGSEGTSYLLRISAVEESATGINALVRETLSTHLKNHSFEIQRLEMVGPKVGADLRSRALEAIYLAILFTAVYISGRFENRWFTAGFMAVALSGCLFGLQAVGVGREYVVLLSILVTIGICLKLRLSYALGTIVSILHDVLITVGIFTLLDKEMDLQIIAALLTVVGYSLNDTIIVYDRIRENLQGNKDRNLSVIINQSINQTISRTVLTSGTTLLVILALLFYGGTILHDFALVMAIGVVTGTLSSIFVAAPILLIFGDDIISNDEQKPDTRPRDADGRLAAQV